MTNLIDLQRIKGTRNEILILESSKRITYICAEESELNLIVFVAAKIDFEVRIEVILSGLKSSASVRIGAFTSGNFVHKISVKIKNQSTNTKGEIFQRGIVTDSGSLEFRSIGEITRNSKKSDSQQNSKIIILSKQASAIVEPILLIDENEVTAGHAASVGKIDKKQLYYLKSRGISETEAKKLIVTGFLAEVIQGQNFISEDGRTRIMTKIKEKLA